ncbi:oligopeptide/dipeptide ABC transporter ATP-binding protein [Actinomadura scrupuli]|uniref:oligopeptide/dipeptide ABC transporter ATP-binding protein n=1 Tax=Actinomadura scrupuli TaxID=559629 RepID=UPI003D976FEF
MDFGASRQFIDEPRRPYARMLAQAFPTIGDPASRLAPSGLPGDPPSIADRSAGCAFAPRCEGGRRVPYPVGAENSVTGPVLGFCRALWLGSGRIVGWLCAVPDRLAGQLDRTARPITSSERCRDPCTPPSTRCTPPPGLHSPAVMGGPGDLARAGAASTPDPPTPFVRHAADAPALARRSGEATVDLRQAPAWTTTDQAHHPSLGAAVGR